MAMNDSSPDQEITRTEKKPYEKPSFRYEQVFVTTALSCGKTSNVNTNCIGHQSAS